MTDWTDIFTRLNSFLGDRTNSKGEYEYPLALRVDGWNFAQDVFAVQHTAQELTAPLSLEADRKSARLPLNCLDRDSVVMVYDLNVPYTTYVRRAFSAGDSRLMLNGLALSYWTWGGKLWFDAELGVTADLQVDYFGKWPRILTGLDPLNELIVTRGEISVPDWVEWPLIYLTAAYCMNPQAIKSASSGDSKSRFESGKPEDNPMRIQGRELLWWYQQLIALNPPQVRQFGGL